MAATAPTTTRLADRRGRTDLPAIATTIGLPVLLLVVFLVLPLGLVALYSFYSIDPLTGLMRADLSLENYRTLLSSPIYRNVFWRTFQIAALATAIALLLAYPMGFAIGALAPRRWQGVLLLLVIVPFWTSYIVRTYGWIGILQENGFLQSLVGWLPGPPPNLLYTRSAVLVGFVHVFLPLMILPIFASARNLDRRLLEASGDLGATPGRTFLRVTLPLTLPGTVAGVVLFFILTFGAFVTPQLLGGTGDLMMGNVIATQFGEAFNWPLGAALSVTMTLVVVTALAALFHVADLEAIGG